MSLRRRRSKRLASAAKERPEDAEWSNLSGDDDGYEWVGLSGDAEPELEEWAVVWCGVLVVHVPGLRLGEEPSRRSVPVLWIYLDLVVFASCGGGPRLGLWARNEWTESDMPSSR